MKQPCVYNQYNKKKVLGIIKNSPTCKQIIILTNNLFIYKLKVPKNHCNNCQTHFFTSLLVVLARWAYFYLVLSLVGLTIDLAISNGISMMGKIAVIVIPKSRNLI